MQPQQIDWGQMAGIATGIWGWQPADFWRATPPEFWHAWAAWCRANGIETTLDRPVNGDELSALLSRFPD